MNVAEMTIAALQMVSGEEVAANLQQAEELVNLAVAQGAKLVALPEYFPIISDDHAARLAACEPFGSGQGQIQDWLATTAQRHGIWLIAGSIPLASAVPGKLRNACVVFDPQGACVACYDKIHLFAFANGKEAYNEAEFITPGKHPVALETEFGRVGLSICYDLRFPELYRQLGREQPLDLIVVPAAFTETTGKAHWEILLRARAIENQCYVLAIGQGGRHAGGRLTHGNSMIIDPWGEILDRKMKGAGIALATLQRQRLDDIRTQLPALQHRVLD